ncbi:MAG: AAA family ATPase, partial [bacterium]|nr:AAA family ATPase [bacterium]
MTKRFNYAGTCIPGKHFMVDISKKLESIFGLIKEEEYFTINRPRQFGKTTTMFLLSKMLEKQDYLVLRTSFAGIGDAAYEREDVFSKTFAELLLELLQKKVPEIAAQLKTPGDTVTSLKLLSLFITQLIKKCNKPVVLMIDEVDKSTNNQLFLSFLGMLRDKYLLRNEGEDETFHSVILAGVHDVKNMKIKVRPNEEKKINSPWNIAVDFTIDLTFSAVEIETMLADYSTEKKISMDIPAIAERLYDFTSGYPFLVSKLCYIIDTYIMEESDTTWNTVYVDRAVDRIIREENTNFDSLIKNLENNRELYKLVEAILLEDVEIENSPKVPLINLGRTYGIFDTSSTYLSIHNRIYKQIIYDYMSLKLKIDTLLNRKIGDYSKSSIFIKEDNSLDFEKILIRFQVFMKEQFSKKDKDFIEANWRLIYIAFIKPIINGHGFDFKEVQVSEEKRLDVAITFYDKKYVTELKIWNGPKKHSKGIEQLRDYLERQHLDSGYLVIFDFKKEMDYKSEWIESGGKQIFAV